MCIRDRCGGGYTRLSDHGFGNLNILHKKTGRKGRFFDLAGRRHTGTGRDTTLVRNREMILLRLARNVGLAGSRGAVIRHGGTRCGSRERVEAEYQSGGNKNGLCDVHVKSPHRGSNAQP